MFTSYSRGGDLPPALRNRLVADKAAADGFSSLSPQRQDTVCADCGRMTSDSRIDEYIRQTDNFLYSDMICSDLSSDNFL